MNGLCFHQFSRLANDGWGEFSHLTRIDVAKVVEMYYSRRLFRIFQRHLPYQLTIVYNEPHQQTSIAPTFTGRGMGITPYNETVLTTDINKRYSTKHDVLEEMREIADEQKTLSLLGEDLIKKIKARNE